MLQTFSDQTNWIEYLSVRCKQLPHVCRLIDEYRVDSIHPQILQDACEHGASSDDLEFIRKRTAPNWMNVVEAAARGGYLHVFEWMLERQDGRCPWESDFRDVLPEAAAHGHLELMIWLCSRGIGNVDNKVFHRAATKGHLSILQWLINHTKFTVPIYIIYVAARNGHLEVVQWLYTENLCKEQTASAMTSAASNGHLEILQWLHQQVCCGSVCTTDIMDSAVNGDHFDVVEWLFEHCNMGCSERAAEFAASNGNLAMLQWLHQHFREKCHSNGIYDAAIGKAEMEGQLDVLKWLHKQGYDGCTSFVMDMAAQNGRLDIIQWLHENRNEGCTRCAMSYAAEEGHLHVVKWLHENRSEGCDDDTMYWSVFYGHLEVVKWLVEHKPELCRDNFMEEAAWQGYLDMVIYLDENTRQRGSEWGLGAAAKKGHVEVVIALMQRDNYLYTGQFQHKIYRCFRRLLSHLSDQGATPASPLWNELLKMLELFHKDRFVAGVLTLLNLALRRGHLALARQFLERRSEQEKCEYVTGAAECDDIVMMRWMIESGAPLCVDTAMLLAFSNVEKARHVEVIWFLSESDRVVVIHNALRIKNRKVVLWVLDNTVFEDETSRNAIRNAFKMADNDIVHWLSDNLSNDSTRSWCFPSHQMEIER